MQHRNKRASAGGLAELLPSRSARCVARGGVAQRLEQRTHNPLALGSNPSTPTIITKEYD